MAGSDAGSIPAGPIARKEGKSNMKKRMRVETFDGLVKEYDIDQVSGIGFRTGEDLAYRNEELIADHMYLVVYPLGNERTDIYDTYCTSIEFIENQEERENGI